MGVVVGYALEAKKVESFLKESLVIHARHRGVHFLALDPDVPLEQQHRETPFDCLVHKLHRLDWQRRLLDFKSTHPQVAIVDCPSAVQRLHNRVSMLDAVTRVPQLSNGCSFGVPRQQLLESPEEELRFPVVAKPVEADGHELVVVLNRQGLEKVNPPAVLQEFVNHGGVVFKVYVAGGHVRCVNRKSLPDINLASILTQQQQQQQDLNIIPFSRISNMAAAAASSDVCDPPSELVTHLAAGLRRELNLNLFNFDMIQDTTSREIANYLIIDINYFPGYAKLPGYESMLTHFFLDVVNLNNDNGATKY